jgi:hypothetical protein
MRNNPGRTLSIVTRRVKPIHGEKEQLDGRVGGSGSGCRVKRVEALQEV